MKARLMTMIDRLDERHRLFLIAPDVYWYLYWLFFTEFLFAEKPSHFGGGPLRAARGRVAQIAGVD